MAFRLSILAGCTLVCLPFALLAETQLQTQRVITINEAPSIAPQPVEASMPQPVAAPPQPIPTLPKPLAAPPQPLAIIPQSEETPAVEPVVEAPKPAKMPFKSGQPETAKPNEAEVAAKPDEEKTPKTFADDENIQISNAVLLQGLNKVTGRISKVDGRLGATLRFGNLEIIARRCWKSSPEERPEDAVLLEIRELQMGEASKRIFLGWMFSSSPGLSGLEHPVYDISVVACEFHPDAEKKPSSSAKPEESGADSKVDGHKKADKAVKKAATKPKKKANPQ